MYCYFVRRSRSPYRTGLVQFRSMILFDEMALHPQLCTKSLKKGGVAKVARRLNAHPLYLFQNKRLLVNRLSVIDKHLSHL